MLGVATQNLGIVVMIAIIIIFGTVVALRESFRDFVKANFGLLVLVFLYTMMFAVAFHVFHESGTNTNGKDFLAWIEQKAGEVLASIMTLIVGIRSANNRSGDGKNGSSSSSSTTTTTSTTGDIHP